MLNFLREDRYRRGCSDRNAGLLPKTQDKLYLEGYLKGRPEGLDSIIQYFPSLEEYLVWRSRASRNFGNTKH